MSDETTRLHPSGQLFPAGPPPGAPEVADYRLIRKIGEGGMGEVWEAQQSQPITRKVALKLIKAGMDTQEVVSRFEAERQALALMHHPHIAHVFDAGATAQGRPYFAMEYVEGIPITKYCDGRELGVRDRLLLFVQVCDGVQHAHQKGVIHRDIKPSNVLVDTHTGVAVPKIIDFGLAKATDRRLTEKTVVTEMGAMLGTPEYASPEQMDMSGDLDTRTDVYSLGVLLYELLVGVRPFSWSGSGISGFLDLRRRICEEEPAKPSARVSPGGGESAETARRRGVDPARLKRQVQGDLDWIVLKALEKDRTRRYGSPNELAADVGRYLRDEPVSVGPPGAAYRAGKFVRRHRGGVTAAALIAASLIAGIIMTSIALLRATRAEADARQEADKAEAVNAFLQNMLTMADPFTPVNTARGRDASVVQVMGDAAKALDGGSLKAQPHVEAAVRATMGMAYVRLGALGSAEPHLVKAIDLSSGAGADPGDLADAQFALGQLRYYQAKYADGEALIRKSWEARRAALGADHQLTLAAQALLGELIIEQGRTAEGADLNRATLEARRRVLGSQHVEVASSLVALGAVLRVQRKPEEAEPLFREALVIQRAALGNEHPRIGITLNHLSLVLGEQQKHADAEPVIRESLAMRRKLLGDSHIDVAQALNNLALNLSNQNKRGEAEPFYRESLAIARQALPPGHVNLAFPLANLGAVLQHLERPAEAEPLLREALAIREKAGPPGNWRIAYSRAALGRTLTDRRKFSEAERLLLAAQAGIADNTEAPALNKRLTLEALVQLYERWNAAAPDAGRAQNAAKWRALLPPAPPR